MIICPFDGSSPNVCLVWICLVNNKLIFNGYLVEIVCAADTNVTRNAPAKKRRLPFATIFDSSAAGCVYIIASCTEYVIHRWRPEESISNLSLSQRGPITVYKSCMTIMNNLKLKEKINFHWLSFVWQSICVLLYFTNWLENKKKKKKNYFKLFQLEREPMFFTSQWCSRIRMRKWKWIMRNPIHS